MDGPRGLFAVLLGDPILAERGGWHAVHTGVQGGRGVGTFSERYGYEPVRVELQYEEMDQRLRTDLWNAISVTLSENPNEYTRTHSPLFTMWVHVWRKPVDELPEYASEMIKLVKKAVFGAPWHEVYDLLEPMVQNANNREQGKKRAELFNHMLKKNLSAWRFVDRLLVQIDGNTDVEAIEAALRDADPLSGVHYHLREALKQLADRDRPNYSLSIKESISAVEATCKIITNQPKATLTSALKRLQDAGVVLHENQIEGWKKLYWYSSDAKGIRHAALEKPEVTQAEARYWLVSCSAFVSLLIHLWQQNLAAVEALDGEA